MGKFIFITLLIIGVFIGAFYYLDQRTLNQSGRTVLTKGTINFGTQEFANGRPIPYKFTCDGKNVNPTLYIERVPSYAKSLVIIMDDPDATPETFTHWIMFNIPSDTTLIEEAGIPGGAKIGTNDFGKTDYDGPCPAIGSHKYFYRIYAIDTVLPPDKTQKREQIEKAIKGHVIATGETYGVYSK